MRPKKCGKVTYMPFKVVQLPRRSPPLKTVYHRVAFLSFKKAHDFAVKNGYTFILKRVWGYPSPDTLIPGVIQVEEIAV